MAIQTVLRRSTGATFRTSFALILVAQLVMIVVAGLLLGRNLDRWIQGKAEQALRISDQAASGNDWSLMDKVPEDQDTAVGLRYEKGLSKLNGRYFPHKEGAVYLVTIKGDEEYAITASDPTMSDIAKANQWENVAAAKRIAVYTAIPVVDEGGTYLAGYTPVLRNGKVVGLVAVVADGRCCGLD